MQIGRIDGTERMIEIKEKWHTDPPDTSRYVIASDGKTELQAQYYEGRWYHITGVPVEQIMGFKVKMWRDKDNVCNKG